jgi:hypothetical protein
VKKVFINSLGTAFFQYFVPGLVSRSWSQSEQGVLAPWSRSCLKKNQEPEPLGKKSGAEAIKKFFGSSALQEDKKHKEIVL